ESLLVRNARTRHGSARGGTTGGIILPWVRVHHSSSIAPRTHCWRWATRGRQFFGIPWCCDLWCCERGGLLPERPALLPVVPMLPGAAFFSAPPQAPQRYGCSVSPVLGSGCTGATRPDEKQVRR